MRPATADFDGWCDNEQEQTFQDLLYSMREMRRTWVHRATSAGCTRRELVSRDPSRAVGALVGRKRRSLWRGLRVLQMSTFVEDIARLIKEWDDAPTQPAIVVPRPASQYQIVNKRPLALPKTKKVR